MPGFLSAHGYEPGPTQRPLLAGAISGVLATIPAISIVKLSAALRVEAEILGLSRLETVAAGCVVMALAGAVYGRLFGRAANDARGGWLFGMAFGFALWAAGAVMVLPLVSDGRAPAGQPAIGLFLSLVAWGAALGAVHPFVHRPLHQSIEAAAKRTEVGPSAAASGRERGPRRELRPPQEPPRDQPQP
jgi:hypothetical protein